MNIVIVSRQFGGQLGTFYALYSQVGSFSYSTVRSYDEEFYYNFGLNTTRFGASTSGQRCIHGLTFIFLDCNVGSTGISSGLFQMNGNEVSGITYSLADVLRIYTVCYGICPSGEDCNNPLPQEDEEQSGSSIAGIIVGVIFGSLIIGGLIAFCIFRIYRRNRQTEQQQVMHIQNNVGQPSYGALVHGAQPQPQGWSGNQAWMGNNFQMPQAATWNGVYANPPNTFAPPPKDINSYKKKLWK